MIDYYQGIEIKTGHSIAYLQSLAARIRSTDSANHIYKILNDIDAELADRENLGNFDDLSRQLIQKLPEIKLYFINDDAKIIYDKQLQQSYRLKAEAEKVEAITIIETSLSKTIDSDQQHLKRSERRKQSGATVYQKRNLAKKEQELPIREKIPSWHKWFFQLVLIAIVLGMSFFLNLSNSLIIIILLFLIVLGLLFSN